MKTNLLLSVLLIASLLNAQERGIIPMEGRQANEAAATRAVIVGISDYRNDRIPDLKFAHRDAEAFTAYLQSPAGGSLPWENIRLLTNEKATTGKMVEAMGWLVEASQPGDRAIIYFSGHGDVERISKFQRGYLLTYDAPPNNYMAGAFPVYGLQDIISTLSDNGVQVIMVSDACRAGKLAGSNINGTNATTAVLAQQFANEIKILSCQPEEFSLEGEQWGGGRGCFSYHLLDGLYGLADKNSDAKVNLLEIERYLEDKVIAEAAPHSQIPMTVGSKATVLSSVNKDYLDQILADIKRQQPVLAGTDSRGIEELVLEYADSSVWELYLAFHAAIEDGNLMEPEGRSANDYYEKLIRVQRIEKLHGYLRRNFAAALQDQSQEALFDYFYNTDKYYSEYLQTKKKTFKNFDKHLGKAAELLGKDHYMYPSLRVRQLYFFSENVRKNADSTAMDEARAVATDSLLRALDYDSSAAFVYKLLGDLHQQDSAVALKFYRQAKAAAPHWARLFVDIGMYYRKQINYHQAAIHLKKAIEIDSSFIPAYRFLGWIDPVVEHQKFTLPKIIALIEGMIDRGEDVFPHYYLILGESYWLQAANFDDYSNIRNGRAEQVLKTAVEQFGDNFNKTHTILGNVYALSGKPDQAIEEYQYVIDNSNSHPNIIAEALLQQADAYMRFKNNCKKAEELYLKRLQYLERHDINLIASTYFRLFYLDRTCLKNNENALRYLDSLNLIVPDFDYGPGIYRSAARLYLDMGRMDGFEEMLRNAVRWYPNHIDRATFLADYHYQAGEYEEAVAIYDSLIMADTVPLRQLSNARDFYFKISAAEKLEKTCRKALTLAQSEDSKYYFNSYLAIGLWESGKNEEALYLYRSMLASLDPSQRRYDIYYPYTLASMAQVQIIMGQTETGWANLEKALSIDPENATLNIIAGQSALTMNQAEKATSYFEQVMQQAKAKDPIDYEQLYEIVRAHAWEGETDLAQSWLERILEAGFNDYHRLQLDRSLEALRKTPRFRDLMETYFSEKTR